MKKIMNIHRTIQLVHEVEHTWLFIINFSHKTDSLQGEWHIWEKNWIYDNEMKILRHKYTSDCYNKTIFSSWAKRVSSYTTDCFLSAIRDAHLYCPLFILILLYPLCLCVYINYMCFSLLLAFNYNNWLYQEQKVKHYLILKKTGCCHSREYCENWNTCGDYYNSNSLSVLYMCPLSGHRKHECGASNFSHYGLKILFIDLYYDVIARNNHHTDKDQTGV